MTWNELKTFCNSLPEQELSKNVCLWREDEAVNDISAQTLEEDHYIDMNNPEDGCFAESDANTDDYQNGIADLTKAYDKGHPILTENF